MNKEDIVNQINYFIDECNKMIIKIEIGDVLDLMFSSSPPYSLFVEKLVEFIANNQQLPENETKEIKQNLKQELDIFLDIQKIINIKSSLESIRNKLPFQQSDKQSFNINSSNIFIVHGHDDLMKSSVSNFIRKIGFNPIILHEQPDGGRTIIEKFQDYSDVAYAVILYSPEDELKTGKFRARQNVILEHGFFIGKLGRNRVVGLFKECDNFEIPSDLQGVLYKPFNNTWEFAVAKEMQYCRMNVDLNKI